MQTLLREENDSKQSDEIRVKVKRDTMSYNEFRCKNQTAVAFVHIEITVWIPKKTGKTPFLVNN